ncbi:hypothetical protein CCP4SC76_5470007 [Gammaproteobacteria bacterium]
MMVASEKDRPVPWTGGRGGNPGPWGNCGAWLTRRWSVATGSHAGALEPGRSVNWEMKDANAQGKEYDGSQNPHESPLLGGMRRHARKHFQPGRELYNLRIHKH